MDLGLCGSFILSDLRGSGLEPWSVFDVAWPCVSSGVVGDEDGRPGRQGHAKERSAVRSGRAKLGSVLAGFSTC